MPDIDTAPLLVKKEGRRWGGYSLSESATPRDLWLAEELRKDGGLNVSVPDGLYYFTIEVVDENNEYVSLAPVPEEDLEKLQPFLMS